MLRTPRTSAPRRGLDARVSLSAAIVGGSVLLAALSLLGPNAPTYDPWAWIMWGREITQLDLDTVYGPSWKPLPVAVTTLAAPLGDAAPHVWMLVARAGAIASVPLAYLVAKRLAGPVAGVAAAATLALAPWYIRNAGMGNSEGLMVALVLATILAHLQGRRGWAFAFAIGCGLLRPEAWPFLGLYGLWLVRDDRRRLPWVAAGGAALLALWLGPELWGSGNAWRASDRAQQPNPDSPAFADNPALVIAENAIAMVPAAGVAGFVLLVVAAFAGRRRDERARVALGLLAVAAAWIGVVAAMTVRGFSGNQRYLVVPVVLLMILGAVGVVWAATLAWPRLRRVRGAGLAAAALALAALFAGPDLHAVPDTLRGIEDQNELERDLGRVIADAGGAERLSACGKTYTGPFLVPAVAWHLGKHFRDVGLRPESPAVVFHVRTIARTRESTPPLSEGGSIVLAERGRWTVTADCRGAR